MLDPQSALSRPSRRVGRRWGMIGGEMITDLLGNIPSSAWLLLAPIAAAWTPIASMCSPSGELLQTHFNQHLRRPARRLLPFLDPFITIEISGMKDNYDYEEGRIKTNDAYEEVKAYLSSTCSREARRLRAEGAVEGDSFVLSLQKGQEVSDEHQGVTMWWSTTSGDEKVLRLTFHQRHRGLVVEEYLPHVRRSGRDAMFRNRRRRLYTNKRDLSYASSRREVWSHIEFDHPMTFDTLAMDPAKKQLIIDDLDNFRNNKDYYRRIGKAWKRGYLLHGPPGTGKSTMIAAMANYLDYDIYDVELTTLHTNSDLRKLFIETTGRSIIVIEDIDCSIDLTGRRRRGNVKRKWGPMEGESKVTLSGLLNFIDGLWSAPSGERIIVFTTNHLEKLDPALIRRGRMDVHVEMSYCCPEAFRTLAKNYLGIESHPLFHSMDELLQEVDMTPADVAEFLMVSKRTDRGADACLASLIDELKNKAVENKKKAEEEEKKAKEKEEEEKEKEKEEESEVPLKKRKMEKMKEEEDVEAAPPAEEANGRESWAKVKLSSLHRVSAGTSIDNLSDESFSDDDDDYSDDY